MPRPENPPAFPTEPNTQPGFYAHHGMSLRDWLATHALTAIITADGIQYIERLHYHARLAYEQADVMLAERSKSQDSGK